MSHQYPVPAAPAAWAELEPSLPFITSCHRNALHRLTQAFRERRPLAVLTGAGRADGGQVIRRFLAGIEDEDVAVARMTAPYSDAISGMRGVIEAIGFEPKDLTLNDLEKILTMFLSFQRTHRRRTIICIEELQNNGGWMLDQISRLVRLETSERFGLLVILSGRPSLDLLLKEPPLSRIGEQDIERIALAPFTLAETREYVRRRIESAGAADVAHVFEFDAISLLHDLSDGVPDALSELCSRCLDLAHDEDPALVTAELVRQAATEMQRALTPAAEPVPEKPVSEPDMKVTGRLVARMDGEVVQVLTLDRGHVLIGRDKDCDIRLVSAPVSRYHALVINSPSGVRILDLGSKNGTVVGDRFIRQCALEDNDRITVGDCMIEYQASEDLASWEPDADTTDTLLAPLDASLPALTDMAHEMPDSEPLTVGESGLRRAASR